MTTSAAPPPQDAPGFGWALVRADGVIAALDAAFAAHFGVAAATDLVGRPWRDLVTPDAQRTLAEIERAARAGRTWRGRLAGRQAAGQVVDLDVEVSPSGRDASIALRVIGRGPSTPGFDTTPPATEMDEGPPAAQAAFVAPPSISEPVAGPGQVTPSAPTSEAPVDERVQPVADLPVEAASQAPPGPDAAPRGRPQEASLEAAAREVPFDWAVLLRSENEGQALVVVEVYPDGLAGAEAEVRWSPPDAAERAVLESGEPALEGALAVHRGDRSPLARLPAYGLRSAVRVPLFARGEVSGIVAAYSTRQDAFQIDDALRLERAVRGLLAARRTPALEVHAPPGTSAPAAEVAAPNEGPLGAARPVVAGAGIETPDGPAAEVDVPGAGTVEAGPAEPSPPRTPTPAPAVPTAEPNAAPDAPSMAEQFDRLGTLGEVMAGVAHELNNPLTAVVGYAQALRLLSPAEQDHAVEVIEREALRAGRIVRNLLTFAQHHPPELTALDLNAIVQRVVDLKRYALQMDNIILEIAQEPVPELRGDAHQLEQALLNLVNNAHQAMTPGGGSLRIHTSVEDGWARVAIDDTGPGVAPELASRVFDPFFTTRGVGGGMGLGLAVVFGTVSAHGGRVWVERAPAGGARFVIELPLASAIENEVAPSPAAPHDETSRPTRGTGQRVLIVDDEEPVRVLTSQVLANFGYAPIAASSAAEALSLLEQGPFEAILTDVRMPGMDGIALYREVERRWPELASSVVIMTGDLENEAVATLLRESGLASLEKPFRLEQLLSTVAAAVGG